MKLLALAAAAALPLAGEYREIEIVFAGTDCVTCIESLEGRLARVRGVESAELDLAGSRITLKLAAGNTVRTAPLRARVTQDGTRIVGMRVAVAGVVSRGDDGWTLAVSGIDELLPMTFDERAAEPVEGPATARGAIVEQTGGGFALRASEIAPLGR